MKKCAIFSGGVIDDPDFICREHLLEECSYVICADSGYVYAEKIGIIPDLYVGDFDSYSGKLPEGISIHRSIPEKDDTDTMLAVREAISRGYDEILLFGGLGARLDHTIANIQTMKFAFDNGCKMKLTDSCNELELQGVGEAEYIRRDGWYFSLFAMTEKAVIGSYTGVKYPLFDYEMTTGFPIGVSNEITAEKAQLRVDSGVVLVIRSKKKQ